MIQKMNTWLLSLAVFVLLMSNVYVGRAQLELAWENTNYHYQYFNRYKKIIQSEEGLVDMRTGNIIYKQDSGSYQLSPDGTRLFTFKAIGSSDSIICTIYDFNTFEKLYSFTFLWQLSGFSIDGITMDNNIIFYHAYIKNRFAIILWDIYSKKFIDTIQYYGPTQDVWVTSPKNYEFTRDGRYLAFQYSTINQLGESSGEYFVILDLLTSERVYAKYIGNGFSYEFMNDKNIMLYPEKIHDSIKKVDNYYLQYFDLDKRKISKSIDFGAMGFGIACLKYDDSKVLLSTTGYNYRFFDLNSEKLSDFIFSPQNGMLNTMRVIFADDSLIYAKNAAFKIDWNIVGVDEEINETEEITVFPNPAQDFITITLNPSEGSVVEIYNSFGELVLADIQHLRDVGYLLRIDVSHLPVGLYFVKTGNMVQKFLKF